MGSIIEPRNDAPDKKGNFLNIFVKHDHPRVEQVNNEQAEFYSPSFALESVQPKVKLLILITFCLFGVIGLIADTVLVVCIDTPSPLQKTVMIVLLAISSSMASGGLMGSLKVGQLLQVSGAFVVFAIIMLFSLAIVDPTAIKDIADGFNRAANSSQKTDSNMDGFKVLKKRTSHPDSSAHAQE